MLLSRRGCVVIDRCPWSTEIFDQLQCLSRHAQGELCVGKIRELMCLVCQDEYFPPDVDGKYFDSFRLSPARSAHDYIREHLSGPLTIHSLAARFNVSPTALKESFHRVYGRSIHRYIRSVRLDAAAKMLLDTTLEVRQISRAVGYSSPSQFTNAFKYRYGMAPGQYRRNKNVI
jgi:AraC-like DNA-binding protein